MAEFRFRADRSDAHEIERVVQLTFKEFDDAFAFARRELKEDGGVLKVILNGRYAKGTWLDGPHIRIDPRLTIVWPFETRRD